MNGALHAGYNLGSGANTIRSATTLSLNTWHAIQFTLQGANSTLTIDATSEDLLTISTPFTSIDVRSNVFLGGHSSFINVSSITGASDGFRGSISEFEVNGQAIELIMGADFGFGVTQSNISSCAGGPCLNNGQCVENGPSFTCECAIGFTGPLCGSTADPCDVGSTMCNEGSTCIGSEDGLSFSCMCPVGFGGTLCEEGEII